MMLDGSFLFNLNGEVIGILDNQERVYPISIYTSAINSLLKIDKLTRTSLGLEYININDFIFYSFDSLPATELKEGARIISIGQPESVDNNIKQESSAGLKSGDIITAINNIEINSINQLNIIVQQFITGEEINISVIRNNEQKQIKVSL